MTTPYTPSMILGTTFCVPVNGRHKYPTRAQRIIAAPVPVPGLTAWNQGILAMLERGRGL